MKKPETKFREKVDAFLDSIWAWHESIQQKAIRGTPDKLCCIHGKFVALELKASEKATITVLQRHKLKEIFENGGYAYLVYPENFDEIKANLITLTNGGTCDRTNLCSIAG